MACSRRPRELRVEHVDEWTIEKQFCEMAGTRNLRIAIESLGLIRKGESFIVDASPDGWAPGGSETYIYRFAIDGTWLPRRELLLKAVTTSVEALAYRRSRTSGSIAARLSQAWESLPQGCIRWSERPFWKPTLARISAAGRMTISEATTS